MRRWLRGALEAAALGAVVATVVASMYLPHADSVTNPPPEGPGLWQLGRVYWAWLVRGDTDDYRYTVHVDENSHWVGVASTERAQTLRHDGLFFSLAQDQTPLSLRGLVHERGFHVALVTFQQLTGMPWLEVFRFLPALWMGATATLLWAALRPWPGALLAAGLLALVPTSARLLGPGFLVPIGFGLAWMVAVLLLLPEATRRGRTAGLLLLVVVWAFFIHLIAGFAALLVVLCALPFAHGTRKGMAQLAAAAFLPMLALYHAFESDIGVETARLEFLPLDFTVFDHVGVPFLALWVAGCALAVLRPPTRQRLPILAATLASLVALSFIIVNVALELRLYALYDRWHQPWAVLACVPVAFALWRAAEAGARGLGWLAARLPARLLQRAGARSSGHPAFAVGLAVLAFVAASDAGIARHIDEPYYHVLNDADWEAFTWAAANVNSSYEVFLAHPWKAPVLSALTGKQPLTWLSPGAPPVRGEDWDAYVQGRYADGMWLVGEEVSLVVTPPLLPASPEYPITGPGTAQLHWDYAQELASIRDARGS